MKAAFALAAAWACLVPALVAQASDLQPDTRGYYYNAREFGAMLDLGSSLRTLTPTESENAHGAMFFVEAIADLGQGKNSCPTPRDRMSPILRTTADYLRAHPEFGDEPAAQVVQRALEENYPCSGSRR